MEWTIRLEAKTGWGEVETVEFGVRVRIEVFPSGAKAPHLLGQSNGTTEVVPLQSEPRTGTAVLRTWRAGDRVTLRHSGGPRKVKEVLERMKVSGAERAVWPVLEINGRILWMRGVAIEPEAGIAVTVMPIAASDGPPGTDTGVGS